MNLSLWLKECLQPYLLTILAPSRSYTSGRHAWAASADVGSNECSRSTVGVIVEPIANVEQRGEASITGCERSRCRENE
jgi:hypothetical protein